MHPRHKSLNLAAATLLLCVATPLIPVTFQLKPLVVQAQTIQDRNAEALQLYEEGRQQLNRGQFREALEKFQQALVIVQGIGVRQGEGLILINIGAVYNALGNYPKALDFHQQALAIIREIDDQAGERIALSSIGNVYKNLGQYLKALEFHQQALAIIREIDDQAGEGTTLNDIGLVYNSLGQYPKALEFYQQALAINLEIGNKAGAGTTLNNIGSVYHQLGQYPKSLEFYQQALAIDLAIPNKVGEGTTLHNIGSVYHQLGQYPKALEFYQQALAIRTQIGDRAGEGTTLNSIGGVYKNVGQYSKALEFYQQALAIRTQIGDRAGEGTTLNNIGAVYDTLRQHSKALEFYQQALAILTQIGDQAGEGTTLNNIGVVYGQLGQHSKALEFYQQALAIRTQIGDQAGQGQTLNNIGAVYDNLGQYPKALEFYQQALAIHGKIGDQAGEGMILGNIGSVYNDLGQYANAEKTLFAGIKVLESLRPGLTDVQKISIFQMQAGAYLFLQQALVAQNKNTTALEVAERGRARAFVELLASKLAGSQVRRLESSDQPLNLQSLQSSNFPTIQQIQQIAKEQKATLVEYSIVYERFNDQGRQKWRESELFIWLVKPTGEVTFKRVSLKSLGTSLTTLVNLSRESIGVRGRSDIVAELVNEVSHKKQLHQLYQLLIEPIADQLPTNSADRVIFIPHQSLFLVPFPALVDANGTYLIEKHTILTAPAIQVLELTRQQRKKVFGKDVLVVGNPTMPSIGNPPQHLPPLAGAEQEALKIAQLHKTKALTGSQATKSAVLQQLSNARIIHLATHGLLDDFGTEVPGAIALAPTGKDNGLLTAGEILDLDINAELVVLSACDTGRGDIKSDGVIGLSRSLITAGAPSVIVSLWAVPDAPTAELMTEFYRQLQLKPDKAQALRQAMLTTMKTHPNPVSWGAFTLMGEAE